jgi:hypothetical protein
MKTLFCILSLTFLLTACSGKGSTEASADSIQDSKDTPKTSQYSCKAALEGVVVYLNKEKVGYICKNESWVDYEDSELFSKLENGPACTDIDKIAVISNRTSHTTIVCHDRDWFFGDE